MTSQHPPLGTASSSSARLRRVIGFTLVELLVVIGIIAVLIAILLPALSRARQAAQTVACLANMQQIGLAMLNYVNENRGYLPPGDIYTGQTYESWASILVGTGCTSAQQAPETQVLSESGVTHSIFRCPSDSDTAVQIWDWNDANNLAVYVGDWGLPSATYGGDGAWVWRVNSYYGPQHGVMECSYGISGSFMAWQGWNQFDSYLCNKQITYDGFGPIDRRLHKLTNVKDASRFAFVFDGFHLLTGIPTRINGRHNNLTITNVLCADGHAESADRKADIPTGWDFDDDAKLNSQYPRFRWRLDQTY